ncbi:BTAD domain-containing putative transcriptional regulator [Actinomadura sp. J1-007]|uniref:ATP-binding protein n=2 Tax=Actinomadura TaxID=1988 RepID=UPI0019D68002|nr:BTAD domain-containing putative transcriptional regulator [Actinomadura sp. J1-007]
MADEGRAALGAGDHASAAALLRDALRLWRGAPFADIADAPSGRAHAVRLEERALAAREDRIDADLRLGRGDAVVPELRELIGRHPVRERLHALLMRALASQGRRAEALEAFAHARRTLADELGTDPSAELTTLHTSLLQETPPDGPFGGGAVARAPAQHTSFVGRTDEVREVRDLLRRARLVTLLGPGGVGKTRLAAEAASGPPDSEACFVELAATRDETGVTQAVLSALDLRETVLLAPPGVPAAGPSVPVAVGRLAAALAERRTLLVLDNCEHVLDAVAALVLALLRACPGLRVLTTSREPLGVTGEHLRQVRPLDGAAAVRLFADRAAAVRPGFTVDGANAADVRRVCAALDDLPLAIELAAARLRTRDIASLASGLHDRLGLLARGTRSADARHRTLRAAIGWSWDLLTADERRAASRFAVFAGGASPEAAAAVCAVPDAANVLESLADKSFLDAAAGRYRMLETIRAYAAERLTAARTTDDDAGRAHALHFLAFAEDADPHLLGAGQLDRLRALAAEHDNLLAALRWAVDGGEVATALRLLAALSTYLWVRGLSTSASGLAARLLDLAGDAPPPGLEEEYAICGLVVAADPARAATWRRHREAVGAVVLAGGGRRPYVPFRWFMVTVGADDARGALALIRGGRDHPHPWARAAAHLLSGFPRLAAGDAQGAEREFGVAAATFREAGDRWGTAMALDALAGLAASHGDAARAIVLTREALGLAERLGAVDDQSDLLCNLGDYRIDADPAAARADYARAADLARRAGGPTYLAAALRGLGDIAALDGDLDGARERYEAALERFDPRWVKSVGNRARALSGLGRLAERRGDLAEARDLHRRAVEAAAPMGARFEGAQAMAGLAGAVLADGDPYGAAALLGAAAAFRGTASPSAPRPPASNASRRRPAPNWATARSTRPTTPERG